MDPSLHSCEAQEDSLKSLQQQIDELKLEMTELKQKVAPLESVPKTLLALQASSLAQTQRLDQIAASFTAATPVISHLAPNLMLLNEFFDFMTTKTHMAGQHYGSTTSAHSQTSSF